MLKIGLAVFLTVTGFLAPLFAQEKAPRPTALKVGDTAPDFTLLAYDGTAVKPVSLHDYKGKKKVIVAFFVFAFTGGGTREMKAFQAKLAKLESSDTQVLGVSIDSPFANHAFALESGITFPLLGDMNATAIKAYRLDKEYEIGGAKILSAQRASFLVNKDGKIVELQIDKEAVDPTKIIDACDISQHVK